jgi:uncharacterized protein YndB with AHSA1/START domain
VARLEVSRVIAAPAARIWDDLSRLETHVEWMADAAALTFLTEQRSGAGIRIAVVTKLGPFRLTDLMEFVAWEPPRRMAVRHTGLVTGSGEFLLDEAADGSTRFTWRERLRFPWYLGGPLGALVGARILTVVWRGNLRRLARRFTP